MSTSSTIPASDPFMDGPAGRAVDPTAPAGAVSAVSWAAILAGAAAAGAATLIMLALGGGLGLAAASPWKIDNGSAAAFTIGAGVWLIVTQWAASALGGYMTGRLRSRWIGTHTHEVFFRDTAHGLLTWAVSTLAVSLLVVASAAWARSPAIPDVSRDYAIDVMLRSDRLEVASPAAREEVAAILATGALNGDMSVSDRQYLDRLVSARSGLSAAEAHDRVSAAITRIKAAADDARKAGSATAFFTAISMLIGGFVACVAAALGGLQRDEHP